MKIISTLPTNYKDSEIKAFKEGIEYLKKLGHNITQDVSLRKGSKKGTTVSAENLHDKIRKLIKNIDILITEVSVPDSKTGFEISQALGEKKIVIALKKDSVSDNEFEYIEGASSRNLIIKTYNPKNISDVIDSAVEEAKKKMDTKFILIISSEIERYLDWAASTKRMHKAQIVRNSIENMMRKDKDYKNYLEE
ncbi:MAG: hypothetical protein Q9M91_05895 [Candidatus Dojkabacteria bacterium]|nr:hypothetical protein [Candidatus Dojkabacteria bacterium]MDQ7021332.1 hypothetical protein [Candidatus Dojkabacteria bacterium]